MCDGGEKPTYSLSGIIDCMPTSTTIIMITYLKFRNGGSYHAFGNTAFCYSLYLMFRDVGMTYFYLGKYFSHSLLVDLIVRHSYNNYSTTRYSGTCFFFVTTCIIFRNVFNQLLGTDRQYISSV